MNQFKMGLAIWGWIVGFAVGVEGADRVVDDQAAATSIVSYQDAFNRRDISAIEALWSCDAVLEDASVGTALMGREAIMGQLKEVFAQERPPTLAISIDSVVVQEDGAILVTGINTLTQDNGARSAVEPFAFKAVIRSDDGQWRIVKVTESTIQEPTDAPPSSNMQSIQWLVGVWTGEPDGEGNQVTNEIDFMPGNRFLVRTFSVEGQGASVTSRIHLGYQVIGTLPNDGQLRSWTFSGDGSVSQGRWIVEPDRISIESMGQLADGSDAAGTHVLQRINEDTMTMKVVGHTIDGEPIPSMGTVTLTRKATSQEQTTSQTQSTNQVRSTNQVKSTNQEPRR